MSHKASELAALTARIEKGGAPKYHAKNAEEGKLFARERIALLCDPDAAGKPDFVEDGLLANNAAADLPFARPTSAQELSSSYGIRLDPFTHRPAFHSGLDFPASMFTPIYSTAPGVVSFTGVRSGYGNTVEVIWLRIRRQVGSTRLPRTDCSSRLRTR